jgi:hypothetical protein
LPPIPLVFFIFWLPTWQIQSEFARFLDFFHVESDPDQEVGGKKSNQK